MVCPQCGAEIVTEAIFCHKCGHRISEQSIHDDPDARLQEGRNSSPGANA